MRSPEHCREQFALLHSQAVSIKNSGEGLDVDVGEAVGSERLRSVLVQALEAQGRQLGLVKEASLGEKHECVVWTEISLQEVNTVLLQSWYCILLGCVQGGHHRLRSDADLVTVEELEQSKEGGRLHIWQGDFVLGGGEGRVEHGVEDRAAH